MNKLMAWSIKLGNMLDVYDVAFYAFIIPILGPILLPENDWSLFLLSGGFIIRPLGTIIFSQLSCKYNVKTLLCVSLAGTGITTFAIGFIPLKIGHYALVCLISLRILQGFFAAGEQAIASIYLLNITDQQKLGSTSGYYMSFSLFGYLLASIAASFVANSSVPNFYWRIPFIIGGLTAIFSLFLRLFNFEDIDINNSNKASFTYNITTLWNNRLKLLRIVLVSGFDVLTYYFVFVFCLKLIPQVSAINNNELYSWNNILLILDIIAAVIVGKMSDKFNKRNWLIITGITFTICSILALNLFQYGDKLTILLIRSILVICAVSYACLTKPWFMEITKGQEQYLIINSGYYLGSELIGRLTPGICMTLYIYSGNNVLAPSFYVVFILILALLALLIKDKN